MRNEKFLLEIGVVDFLEPTLLLVGDEKAFKWIAEEILNQKEFTIGRSNVDCVHLTFRPKDHCGILIRKGNNFVWEISQFEAQVVAEQLKELSLSDLPSHAYLDPELNKTNIQIIASINEYKPDQIFSSTIN